MKKGIISIGLAFLFLAVLAPSISIAGVTDFFCKKGEQPKIGVVYGNIVFQKHPLRSEANEALQKLQQQFKASTDDYLKMHDSLIGKKEEGKKELEKATPSKMAKIQELNKALQEKQQEYSKRMSSDIEEAELDIAKGGNFSMLLHFDGKVTEKGNEPAYGYISFVAEKNVSLIDLTNEILSHINKKYEKK